MSNDREELQAIHDQQDARRWRKLLALVGTPANASDCTVKLFWDDATMTPLIAVGRDSHFVEHGGFNQIIDSIKWPEV